MSIVDIYQRFPAEVDCIQYLEKIRWHGKPTCPYCNSKKINTLRRENRYHCNTCNTSFSVKVRTIFHRSRVPLQKWFLAITLILNTRKGLSARQLARDIQVNKDTAWSMGMRIRKAMFDQRDLLLGIVEMDETYIGGKPRKGGGGPRRKPGRGTTKTPVVGMVERGGKVQAVPVKNLKTKTLASLVRGNINTKDATVVTDEFVGYARLSAFVNHKMVNHKIRYVDGEKHTNTIESFSAILKRGITGQFRKVSIRYLPKYLDEFCYRFNHRKNNDVFDKTLSRAVGA